MANSRPNHGELSIATRSISDGLLSGNLFAGRAGETELAVWRMCGDPAAVADRVRVRAKAKINAGIWPPTEAQLLAFSTSYEQAFSTTTHVGVWGNLLGEENFLAWTAPAARRVPLRALDPVLLASEGVTPWSSSLRDMTVLVVAPFAELAAHQMLRRATLFRSDFEVLPHFNLAPIVPPQTQALMVSRKTWSRGLQDALRDVDRMASKVDVALLSAGSYGMPLAAHVARYGIPVIYVGGSLQLLFGIEGARWANSPNFASIRGEGWMRSALGTKPKGFKLVEGGAYW